MGQWMAGFYGAMREESNQSSKEAMLDYLIYLLDDANDFLWASAKASHAVLLCRMEQGEIKDYTQTEQLDRLRRAHAQRHTILVKIFQRMSQSRIIANLWCTSIIIRVLAHNKAHTKLRESHTDVCLFCFTKIGKNFQHAEMHCRNKQKTKNK